jgi:hypothetical protein
MVEYSPANEQVEMVTRAPDALIVAVPKAEVKEHWLWAEYPVNNSNENIRKYNFFINTVWLKK